MKIEMTPIEARIIVRSLQDYEGSFNTDFDTDDDKHKGELNVAYALMIRIETERR